MTEVHTPAIAYTKIGKHVELGPANDSHGQLATWIYIYTYTACLLFQDQSDGDKCAQQGQGSIFPHWYRER